MTLEVTAYTGLGPGPHDVVVSDVTVKVAKAGGNYLRWEFSDINGNNASANTSQEMTPGNKTGRWFAALTGRTTEVGQKRELAEVIGKPAAIFIELNAEGYPKVISVTARQATPTHRPSPALTASQEAPGAEATAAAAIHAAQEDELPF